MMANDDQDIQVVAVVDVDEDIEEQPGDCLILSILVPLSALVFFPTFLIPFLFFFRYFIVLFIL